MQPERLPPLSPDIRFNQKVAKLKTTTNLQRDQMNAKKDEMLQKSRPGFKEELMHCGYMNEPQVTLLLLVADE